MSSSCDSNSTESMQIASQILSFMQFSEALKKEMRHSWLSDGRQESVAEHTWQMSLLALLLSPYLTEKVDLLHVLKMITIHDLVEAEAGDVPFFETGSRKDEKQAREQAAIANIEARLPGALGHEVRELWYEFEERTSAESKFAVAIDTLEAQIQHNLADLSTWLEIEHELVFTKLDAPCDYDPFLKLFKDAVKQQSIELLEIAGVDIVALEQSLKSRSVN